MKSLAPLIFFLISLPLLSDVKVPASKEFFKDENTFNVVKLKGTEIRMISTKKTFKELKAELEKLIGKNWKESGGDRLTEDIKEKIKKTDLSEDSMAFYSHRENAKFRINLALTAQKGKAAGESVALLTIFRELK